MIGMKTVAALGVCAALLTVPGASRAEERTVNAYAPWDGRGQIFPTGENQATFVGAFGGVMFVERDGNVVNSGNIMCPGMVKINLKDGSQVGQGQCTLADDQGDEIYAEWTCAGTSFVRLRRKVQVGQRNGRICRRHGGGRFPHP